MMWISACTPSSVKFTGSGSYDNDASSSTDDSGSSNSGDCRVEDGEKACQKGFHCAALDGAAAKCIANNSRADGELCTADAQCGSYRCNSKAERCAASPDAACDITVGCGLGDNGTSNYVCTDEVCKPSTGESGKPCTGTYDCLSGICKGNQCIDGKNGDACDNGQDCKSGKCTDGTCKEGGQAQNVFCAHDGECDGKECIDGRCNFGGMGSTCRAANDCNNGLTCNRKCEDLDCASACTDGRQGSPCIDMEPCAGDMSCSGGLPWPIPGAPGQVLDSCASEQACELHMDECPEEGERCMRTASGNFCGKPGTSSILSSCTDDADCASGLCTDHGLGQRKCAYEGGWGAACAVWTEGDGSVLEVGCAEGDGFVDEFQCDTSSGPPVQDGIALGYCGGVSGHFCYTKHNLTESTFDRRGGCADGGIEACAPFDNYCEHDESMACESDKDCACDGVVLGSGETCELEFADGRRCLSDYYCP